MPPPDPFAQSPEFSRLLRNDPAVDLCRLALELASDAYPALEPAPYLGWLDHAAARVLERVAPGATFTQILKQINWVLYVEEGLQGNEDDYYDPRNSYLNEVIDRKLGIPISLSTVYLALAHRLGVPMAGVNLPAHFVIRLLEPGSGLFIDPFAEGEFLDSEACLLRASKRGGAAVRLTPELLVPCDVRQTTIRMLRNLKAIYLRQEDMAAMLPVVRRLAALAHDDPEESRDLGVVCLAADRPGEAVAPLQHYLARRPEAPDVPQISGYLRMALRDVAIRN